MRTGFIQAEKWKLFLEQPACQTGPNATCTAWPPEAMAFSQALVGRAEMSSLDMAHAFRPESYTVPGKVVAVTLFLFLIVN